MACEGRRQAGEDRDPRAKRGDGNVSRRKSSYATYYYDNADDHKLLWPSWRNESLFWGSPDFPMNNFILLLLTSVPWFPSPSRSHLASRLFS